MECPQCGREFVPRRRVPWAWRWCSSACRRRMIRELRELSFTVSCWGAALEMPDVVRARDDVGRRYVKAVLASRPAPPEDPSTAVEGDDEIPLDEIPLYVPL